MSWHAQARDELETKLLTVNCIRLKLDATATTIMVRDGWLVIETSDADELQQQLDSSTGSRLLSVAEVSRQTGFTAGAVRAWLKSRKLVGTRIGKEYRIRQAELDRFLGGAKKSVPGEKVRIGRGRLPVIV